MSAGERPYKKATRASFHALVDVTSGSETGVQHHAEVLRLRPGLEPLAGQQPRRKLCQKLTAEDDAVAFRLLGVRMDEVEPPVSRKARDQIQEYAKVAGIC